MTGTACDFAAVPEWAREHTARLARESPECLPLWLEHVAEVDDARRRLARRPPVRPGVPEDPRDFLHLLAVQAHLAMACGQAVPVIEPRELCLLVSDAFETPGGNLADEVHDTWHRLTGEYGVTIADEEGEFLQPLEAAVSDLIAAAIWFGITTGHYVLTGECPVPRRLMPYLEPSET